MEKHELMPTNGRKSFYGKAFIEVDDYCAWWTHSDISHRRSAC